MGRGTTSDIVYFEQLGRLLSVRGETKEKFDSYEKYSVEELLVPIIIDLTNNSRIL